MASSLFHSVWFLYVILPLLIFCTRIVDVTLDTLRVVYISRGNKVIAPILGFFAVMVWLIAITQIMQHLDNFICYIAYAGGFATGNYVGLILEEKLAIGHQVIRVITSKDSSPLIEDLRTNGYGVTTVWAEGKNGQVHIIFLIVKRSNIPDVISKINLFNPKAFYTIEDVRSLNVKHNLPGPDYMKTNKYRWLRKGRPEV
jgi:uncharacterized protein YebE (UPF0316 family)